MKSYVRYMNEYVPYLNYRFSWTDLISHGMGRKLGRVGVLLATRSEVASRLRVQNKPSKLGKATQLVYAHCSARTRLDPIVAP